MTQRRLSPGRRGVLLLALTAVAVGAVLVAVALAGQHSAPRPHDAGRLPGPASSSSHSASGEAPATRPPLGPSKPLRISIPALGIHSRVNPIGLDGHGVLAVPQPGPHLNEAAWFVNSPTPGQIGPAIIEGHVDSPSGPSVFFKLGSIKPGNKIHVHRADGVDLTYTVRAVRDFPKSRFPTRLVYGGDGTNSPGLRLITCSDFNTTTHHHEGNEVVFAALTHRSR